jgi:hypothetical protein
MNNIYAPCLCGSGKKFKFCCYQIKKNGGDLPPTFECCKFPIYECKIIKNWKKLGISNIFVSRELAKGFYVFISYLVDFWCLGLKDTLLKFGISQGDLSFIYSQCHDDLVTIPYQDARNLILGAIDFAKAIDISPHSSWNGMSSFFIEAHLPYEKKFSFGRKGKPFYFSGPNDHKLYNVKEVIKKVLNVGGDYVVHVPEDSIHFSGEKFVEKVLID